MYEDLTTSLDFRWSKSKIHTSLWVFREITFNSTVRKHSQAEIKGNEILKRLMRQKNGKEVVGELRQSEMVVAH